MEGNDTRTEVLSVKDWVITILITAIPIVGLVMLFVWAFSEGENLNKSNWAKASLIWMLIGIGLAVLIMILVGIFAATTINQYS